MAAKKKTASAKKSQPVAAIKKAAAKVKGKGALLSDKEMKELLSEPKGSGKGKTAKASRKK